jgi:hypothetical protein
VTFSCDFLSYIRENHITPNVFFQGRNIILDVSRRQQVLQESWNGSITEYSVLIYFGQFNCDEIFTNNTNYSCEDYINWKTWYVTFLVIEWYVV